MRKGNWKLTAMFWSCLRCRMATACPTSSSPPVSRVTTALCGDSSRSSRLRASTALHDQHQLCVPQSTIAANEGQRSASRDLYQPRPKLAAQTECRAVSTTSASNTPKTTRRRPKKPYNGADWCGESCNRQHRNPRTPCSLHDRRSRWAVAPLED